MHGAISASCPTPTCPTFPIPCYPSHRCRQLPLWWWIPLSEHSPKCPTVSFPPVMRHFKRWNHFLCSDVQTGLIKGFPLYVFCGSASFNLSVATLCLFPFFLTRLLYLSLQEMIIDKVNGHPVPRYLIYDIIKFNVSSPAILECTVLLLTHCFRKFARSGYHTLQTSTLNA